MPARRRAAVRFLAATLLVFVPATPALADPAVPTNYASMVTDLEPQIEGVRFEVVGGDSFIQVTSEGGHVIEIAGYFNEPYVRIDQDGSVFVNERSPAFFINADRYGETEVPSGIDAETESRWVLDRSDGRYAWHDHRVHWMSEDPPPVAGGDERREVFPWQITVTVDGRPVTVVGELVWVPVRSPLPALMAGALALLPLVSRRMPRSGVLSATAIVAAVLAGVVAVAQYLGTPAGARPPPVGMLGPALALVCAGASVRVMGSAWGPRLLAVGGLALVGWAGASFDVLVMPVLPSALPPVAERAVVAAVLWAGVGVTAWTIRSVGSPGVAGSRAGVRPVAA